MQRPERRLPTARRLMLKSSKRMHMFGGVLFVMYGILRDVYYTGININPEAAVYSCMQESTYGLDSTACSYILQNATQLDFGHLVHCVPTRQFSAARP